jgi:hypothetical protein
MTKRVTKKRALRWKRKRAHLPGYKPEIDTAHALGVAVRTLRKWRQQGVGPPFVKVTIPYRCGFSRDRSRRFDLKWH